MAKETLSSQEICVKTDKILSELGFETKTEEYLGQNQYLVLFDQSLDKHSYQFGKDSCIDYELFGDEMRVNDIWVTAPFPSRSGIGKKLVNEGLVKLAEELGMSRINATSLSTSVAQGFWKNLPGWKCENEINFSYDVN